MNFKPIGNRVLVEKMEAESKTASGIYIPDSSKDKPNTARVIAVGKVQDIFVDDTIVFEQFKGVDFKLDGKDYLILNVENVIGIIKK